MITLVLADDFPVTRQGLHAVINIASDIQIVGEAQDFIEVKKLVDELKPKILLLDLRMPGSRPLEIEEWVRKNCPATAVLVLTAHDCDAYLAGMLEAGVSGYLIKKETAQGLINAIRRAARGEKLFTDEQYARAFKWNEAAGRKWKSLTKREREVMKLLICGSDNMAIAQALEITSKTVAHHITNILDKLGQNSRWGIMAWVHKYWPDGLE